MESRRSGRVEARQTALADSCGDVRAAPVAVPRCSARGGPAVSVNCTRWGGSDADAQLTYAESNRERYSEPARFLYLSCCTDSRLVGRSSSTSS
jgi:hypothetical protein